MSVAKFHIIIPPQDIETNPQCLQRIASGDRTAFGWLYKNYCGRLYEYLFLLSNDKQLSEDIVQDIFIKLWSHNEQLAEIKNFNGYIFQVAKNLLADKWKKQQSEVTFRKHQSNRSVPFEQNLFYQKESDDQIKAAIKTLSPRQQLIYKLIREEGLKREEISKHLNLSPNTVKATMQKALHKLKEELAERR